MGAEDRVCLAGCTATGQPTAIGKQRVDVLPHNLVAHGDLNEPTRGPLTDQRVAVGLSLRPTDLVAVERDGRFTR